jgi:hypothetical protein
MGADERRRGRMNRVVVHCIVILSLFGACAAQQRHPIHSPNNDADLLRLHGHWLGPEQLQSSLTE